MITVEMVNTGAFIIVERSQMDGILKEQNFQMSGCTDASCAVKIGKMISARKILIGSVSRVGETYTIAVRMVDVERGEAEGGATERVKSDSDLPFAADRIADKITESITGREAAAPRAGDDRSSKFDFSSIFTGKAPSGIALSYAGFSPSDKMLSDYYSSMMGGAIGYVFPGGKYFTYTAGADFVTSSDDESGDSRMSFNTYSIGARLGVPFLKIFYPYCGLSVKGTWLSEKGKSDSANFFGYGAGFSAGLAVTIYGSFGLYGEYGMTYGKVSDERGTDISGSGLGIGLIFRL